MLPTVLRQWSWPCSYFVWLCGFYYGAFRVVLPCSLFSCFFSSFSIVIISLGEERAGLCASCACLFTLHAVISVLFLHLLVSGVGCGLWLWHSLVFSINFFYQIKMSKSQTLFWYTRYIAKHKFNSLPYSVMKGEKCFITTGLWEWVFIWVLLPVKIISSFQAEPVN